MPVIVWSRLFLDVEPYLAERSVPPGTVAGFYHRQVAERVQTYSFAPGSGAIAALERYDREGRIGSMSVTELPDGKPVQVGKLVPNYVWAPDGKSAGQDVRPRARSAA